MATVSRFNGNSTIPNGTTSTSLASTDIIPVQPVSQGLAVADGKITIAQAQARPYATCTDSATTTSRTATIQNFKSYVPVVGSEIKVKFTYAYTPATDTQLTLTIGGVTAPCTAHGTAMMTGSIFAGMCVNVFYTGTNWDFDTDVVQVTSDYTVMSDNTKEYSKTQVDSKLSSDYEPKQTVWSAWSNSVQTSINVNGYDYGKTVLIMISGHSGTGYSSYSEVGMLWCGYNNDYYKYKTISCYGSNGSVTSSQVTTSLVDSKVKFAITGVATIAVKAIALN